MIKFSSTLAATATVVCLLGLAALVPGFAQGQPQQKAHTDPHKGHHPGAAAAHQKPGHSAAAAKHKKATYECAHCNLLTAKAGKCPKCGMKLTKASAAKVAKAQYECSHCHVMSAKAGKCPVCKRYWPYFN